MQNETVNVSVPDGFEDVVATTERELEDQVRLMAALKMFELGKLSSGLIRDGCRGWTASICSASLEEKSWCRPASAANC